MSQQHVAGNTSTMSNISNSNSSNSEVHQQQLLKELADSKEKAKSMSVD